MEFVLADADPEGWLGRVALVLRLRLSPGLLVVLLEYLGGVRIGAFHVAIPLPAWSFHVFSGSPRWLESMSLSEALRAPSIRLLSRAMAPCSLSPGSKKRNRNPSRKRRSSLR